jgi:hypothetical protein
MRYVRAVIAAAVLSLACSCAPKLYYASDVHDRGEYIGFRVKKGRNVYQVLKRDGKAWIEKVKGNRECFEWVPIEEKPITPELEKIFNQVEEEERTRVDITNVLD